MLEDNKETSQVTLDGQAATQQTIDEAKQNLAGNQKIVETKPGEHHTLTRMQD